MSSRFTEILNKQIKRSFTKSDYEMKIADSHIKEWEKQGQQVKLKTEMDYILMSTIFQSIDNKHKIEEAYILVRDNLAEFWGTLDYSERKRIVNFDMAKTYKSLPSFYSFKDGKTIYISFFDDRMNDIYSEESVMFELKQYHNLFKNYNSFIIPFSIFDYDCFNGEFVPTLCVVKDEESVVLYNRTLAKFYVLENDLVTVYPLFDRKIDRKTMTKELLIPLAELLVSKKDTEYFNMAKAFGLYSEDFYKKVNRMTIKKHIFF